MGISWRSRARSTRAAGPLALALTLSMAPSVALNGAASAAAPPTQSGAPTARVAPACAVDWGSRVKRNDDMSSKPLRDIRAGRHRCFDRLVFDIAGRGRGEPGFFVRYVRQVTHEGSGAPVALRGGARLNVTVRAPAHTLAGRPTYRPANRRELVDVSSFRTFRQVAYAGSFEGQTTVGLGVRARLPMRAMVLDGPGGGYRVVVDVAHRWPPG